jgi:hypothetical protein
MRKEQVLVLLVLIATVLLFELFSEMVILRGRKEITGSRRTVTGRLLYQLFNIGSVDQYVYNVTLPHVDMYKDEEIIRVANPSIKVNMKTNRSKCDLKRCGSFSQISADCIPIDHKYSKENLLYYHTYWRNGMHYMLTLQIKSYLVTQPLEYTKMVVWSEEKLSHPDLQELKNKYPNNVIFKILNFSKLAEGTCMHKNPVFAKFMQTIRIQMKSDVVRVMLLNRYGGVWADTDILFLQDLIPLINVAGEFSSFIGGNQMNNHLLHINKNSGTGIRLTQSLCRLIQTPNRLPVKTITKSWMLNDALTAYCNLKLGCGITPVSRCFADPEWEHRIKYCGTGPVSDDVRKKLSTAFIFHHRLDDCGPKLPDNHILTDYVQNVESRYQYSKPQVYK